MNKLRQQPLLIVLPLAALAALLWGYLFFPLPPPSWAEQVQMALDAAHDVDEEALLLRINARPSFGRSAAPVRGPRFGFFTPDGSTFFIRLERVLQRIVAVGSASDEIGRGPLPKAFVRRGSDWFREAAMQIRISPDEASEIGHTALQQEYPDSDVEPIAVIGLHIVDDLEQDYGTRAIWAVSAAEIDIFRSDSSITVAATAVIDARSGEVLVIREGIGDSPD